MNTILQWIVKDEKLSLGCWKHFYHFNLKSVAYDVKKTARTHTPCCILYNLHHSTPITADYMYLYLSQEWELYYIQDHKTEDLQEEV